MTSEKADSAIRSTDVNLPLMAFCICLCAFLAAHTSSDYDLWGHLKFGLDYIANGSLPSTDSYSYVAAGSRWISHSWLFELVAALAYLKAGTVGLCLFKFSLSLAVLLLLLLHFRQSGVGALSAATVTLLAALAMLQFLTPLRPQLCTYLLFTIELCLLSAAGRGRHRALFVLPPLFFLWSNLHGGFAAGLLMLVAWCVLSLAQDARRGAFGTGALQERATVLVLCAVATLANPYGVHLWQFLLNTLSVPRPEITEWLPLKLLSAAGAQYLLVLSVCTAILIADWKTAENKNAWSGVASGLVLLAAVLPLLAYRHLPLFVITAMVFSAPSLALLQAGGQKMSLPSSALTLAVRAALWLAAGIFLCVTAPLLSTINVGSDMPRQAVALLAENHLHGNLATHFDWGEYCIFHLYPAMRVSTDGRREEVYSPADHQVNVDFLYAVNDWDRLLKSYPTDAVLAPKNFPVYGAMCKQADWQLVYQDTLCGIFVRKTQSLQQPWASLKSSASAPPPGSFP